MHTSSGRNRADDCDRNPWRLHQLREGGLHKRLSSDLESRDDLKIGDRRTNRGVKKNQSHRNRN